MKDATTVVHKLIFPSEAVVISDVLGVLKHPIRLMMVCELLEGEFLPTRPPSVKPESVKSRPKVPDLIESREFACDQKLTDSRSIKITESINIIQSIQTIRFQ